jgi:apolipoprotein N-acyltransferase
MSAGHGLGTNAAFLAAGDGTLSEPYEKRHLLWFGETVPLADVFPWLRRVFARGTGLVAGDRAVRFEAGPIRAAVLNCYEDTLPEAGREAMATLPNLLVNVTNDAWFAGSAEGELHLRLAVLRAVEARRDLVRAVNRGPTSFVDAAGRVVARVDDGFPSPLLVTPALLDGAPTAYMRLGDAPGVVLLAAAFAGIFVATKRRGRSPSRTAPASSSLPATLPGGPSG